MSQKIDKNLLLEIAADMATECWTATKKFGAFNSTHEGYAVILEELDEAWVEIKADNLEDALKEMVQVGAMAIRFIYDLRSRGVDS